MLGPYEQAARTFLPDLTRSLGAEPLRKLHRLSGWRHLLVAVQPPLVLALAVWVIWTWPDLWYAWIPASIAIGFVEASNAHSRARAGGRSSRGLASLRLTVTALPDDWTPVPALAGRF